MKLLYCLIRFLRTGNDGVTAVEYALLAGGLACGIIAAVFAFGDELGGVFSAAAGAMADVTASLE